jgi:hypothetical protein
LAAQTAATLGAGILTIAYQEIIKDAGEKYFLYRNAKPYTLTAGKLRFITTPPTTPNTTAGSEGTATSTANMTFYFGAHHVVPFRVPHRWDVTPEQIVRNAPQMIAEYPNVIKDQAYATAEYWIHKQLVQRSMLIRADENSVYEKYSTVNDAAGTVTSFVTDLTEADDYWNTGNCVITSGKLWGQARPVNDWVNGTSTISFAAANAFDYPPDESGVYYPEDNATFFVNALTGIDSSKLFTTHSIESAFFYLDSHKAPGFGGAYDFKFGISPQIHKDLTADDRWGTMFQHAAPEEIEHGFTKVWMNCAGYRMKSGFRVDSDSYGTYAPAGAIHFTPFFGPNAFGCVKFAKLRNGKGLAGIDIHTIDKPDTGDPDRASIIYFMNVQNSPVVPNALGMLCVASGSTKS